MKPGTTHSWLPLRPSYVSCSPPHLPPLALARARPHPQTGWVRLSRVFMGLAEDMGFVNLWRAVETGRRIMSPGLGSGKSGNDRGTQRYNKVTRLADTR